MISEDSIFLNQVVSDEIRQRELLMDDEEEDFLDECLVNPTGCKIKIHFETDQIKSVSRSRMSNSAAAVCSQPLD